MLRSLQFMLIFLLHSMLFVNAGYSQDRLLTSWYGEYHYSESPEKANADYSMVMEWRMNIGYSKGMNQATIHINGQQTQLIVCGIVEGNSDQVIITLNEPVYGCCSEKIELSDTLLILTKTKAGIITTWGKLSPRLSETAERECVNCFVKAAEE